MGYDGLITQQPILHIHINANGVWHRILVINNWLQFKSDKIKRSTQAYAGNQANSAIHNIKIYRLTES